MLSTRQKSIPKYIPFFALSLILIFQWPASYVIQNISRTLGALTYEWFIIAGVPLLIARYYTIPRAQIFPFKSISKKTLLYTLLMTFSLLVIIDYLTFLSEIVLPPPPEIQAVFSKLMLARSQWEVAWIWFLICVTPAVCEEIFFRGFFQRVFGWQWGEKLALVVTATAFALIHGIPWYWHLYFILGFFLSWLLFKKENLWLPMLAHLLNNSWTYIHHLLGTKIPREGIWRGSDSLTLIACLIVFWIAAWRFSAPSKNG